MTSHPSLFPRRPYHGERLPDARAGALAELLASCDAAATLRVALVHPDAVPEAAARRAEEIVRRALSRPGAGSTGGAGAGADSALTWREVHGPYARARHLVAELPGASQEQTTRLAATVREELRVELRAEAYAGTDHAVTTGELAVGRVRLIVSDASSTFLVGEVIDELAHRAGSGPQVAAITAAAMNGQLGFEQSLRACVATLKGLTARALVEIEENLTPSPGAIRLLRRTHAAGARLHIVSGAFTPILDPVRQRFGVDKLAANDLTFDAGRLTGEVEGAIVDGAAKAAFLRQWAAEVGTTLDACAAVGDDVSDLDMIRAAGLGVAYSAQPATAAQADAVITNRRLDVLADFLALPLT